MSTEIVAMLIVVGILGGGLLIAAKDSWWRPDPEWLRRYQMRTAIQRFGRYLTKHGFIVTAFNAGHVRLAIEARRQAHEFGRATDVLNDAMKRGSDQVDALRFALGPLAMKGKEEV